ncbi:MAG: YDG domain-containing protein, partial [Telluria sp.]
TLAASASGVDKIYDGGTSATVTFGDDRVVGDLLALTGSASFLDKHAGNGKAIGVSGIALGGLDAANYTLASTSAVTSASIGQRTLVASASGVDKTYEGGTNAMVTFGDDRVAGDLLALTGSASFLDKHAGAGTAIAVAGVLLEGADAGNSTLASTSLSTQADIARRALAASATGIDKVYDGSTAATVTFGDDRVAGDQLNLTGNASFGDRNAGSGKLVGVSSIALDGLDAANYSLASTVASASAAITPRALAVSVATLDKVYDGSTAATVLFGDDRVAGDLLALGGTASFSDRNAGSGKLVSVTGIALSGADAANYRLSSTGAATSASIGQRTLAASASGVDKTYDGGTSASVTFGDDRIAGDLLALTGSASFLDKHAGAGKVIVVSGVTLGGADAGNYTLASTSVSTEADIARRTLVASASGVDKVYDGSAAATVNFGDDRVAGDELSLTGTASFADRNAGAGKTVTVSGLVLSGPDAANYTLAATAGSATAAITPRELAVSASSVDKVYDGGTAASVTLADDRVAGDILDLAHAGAAFGDRNVGAGKAIAVHGLALGGRDAANYRLASTASAASAAITPRTLAVAATGVDKVYDGRLDAAVVLADDRVAGDLLDIAASASFLDQHAGAAKTVTLDGLALSGLDAGNYRLAPGPVPAQAAITPRVLAASLSGPVAKTYDGGSGITLAAGQVVLGGFVAGEGANVAAIEASFDSARVLQARSVSAALPAASVAAAAGTRLANYLLPATVSGAGTIHARALTVTGMRAATKVYDGTTSASLLDIGTLDGLVAGESLQLSGPDSVAFATRGAGSGKLVTATGYRIADGATGLASNYALVPTASTSDSVVKQATLTVRANDASRVAGALNPEFTYSFSGLAAGDSPAILPEMTASTAANAASAAGSYAITVGTRVDTDTVLPDYRLAFLDGVLTVTAAPIPIPTPAPTPAPPAPPVPEPAPAPLPAPAVPEPVLLGALQEVRTEEDRRPHAAPVLVESAGEVCLPPQGAEASVLTLSGGTEVLTVDGGIRTTE